MPTLSPFRTYKRNRLLNSLILLCVVGAGFHAIWDASNAASTVAVWLDLGIMGWMLGLYFLNRLGYSNITRYLVLISTSLIVVVYGSLVPAENGVSLLFLPMMSLAFVFFEYRQHLAKGLVSLFVLGCYMLLEITDYQILGEVQLLEEPDQVSYIANFITAGILLFFSLNFISQANYIGERHLQQMAEELQQRNNLLSKANEELDRFVYSTSHDLRAPLLSVMGLIQLLEKKDPEEPTQPYLDMMRERIQNLETFINDITNYARNARLPVQYAAVDLDELVKEVFANHRYLQPESSLNLRRQVQLNSPVQTDRQRLLIILNNLVSNAIKYHHYQHQAQVTVGAKLEQNKLHLWVQDDGPGIRPEVRQRMFEMFYRGDERSKGSGLGLYIVKESLEKLHGKIDAESQLGTGSTFHVWLPAIKEEGTPVPPKEMTEATSLP